MGCDIYIYCDEWNWCLYLIYVVWRPGECEPLAWKIYLHAECDSLLMLLLVTLIDMWWCWYLWWYWFEMTLLIKTMSTWIDGTVNDYVHINEVVVVLITSLRRDDVYEWCENGMLIDVGNALACACCVCSWGVHWPCQMAHSWGTRMVKESKHSLQGCLGTLICPSSLHLMVSMFDTLDVVYVRGGVLWPCRMAHSWGTRVVKEFKHFLGDA